MKIELKHLAAYLPYKLSCLVSDKGQMKIAELHSVYSDLSCTFYDIVESQQGFEFFKPILIPLSDLKKYSNGIMHLGYRTDENNFHNLISDIKNGIAEYKLMQMCFEEHIDVFGLIDAGYAINKNL